MKTIAKLGLLVLLSTQLWGQSKTPGRTFLFVHGGWGGGWEYKKIDSMLTSQGDVVYRPTMTGLGERVHLANPDINLTTHVNDIVNVIKFEDLHNVILVGHSYGGMVITGVAEQVPDRIGKMIYLDAFVPNDGESLFAARGETEATAMTKPFTKDGFVAYFFGPVSATPPTDVPQPLKTFTEPLSVKNPAVKKISTFYILMAPNGDMSKANFAPFAERAKQRGWTILQLNGNHYPMRNNPAELIKTLEKCK
ncbi:MAG: alpha/beta hydrolase [Haliscomenobacter sp.]|uniref:alpha/beta fold hydrolase n=1 Tax=Haliscomenobacter sp. TaxID=2717303 RepID=UPI0029BD15E1|nr:alpha/beta hydrolase [Haliscomenobacter sp.]MDX2070113.1 alpha/beta hydrolase [Haliscomenobacter sp.]